MNESTRARMVTASAELFRERGYDGTGFRDVVALAGAARGVIYHHFPGGKAELGAETATRCGTAVSIAIREASGRPAKEALADLLEYAEQAFVAGDRPPGCPVAAAALAADDPDGVLRDAAAAAYRSWVDELGRCLTEGGVARRVARDWATMAVAAIEGAIILCRAERSAEPFRRIASTLLAQLPS